MAPPSNAAIRSFRDALGFALELADRHPFASAAILIDGDGRRGELAVAEGLGAGIEPVVAWAATFDGWSSPIGGVLAVSIRPFDPEVVREADLRRFRQAGWALSQAGQRLLDWIETDGDLVRSYAYLTCPARAWPDDPPGHRLGDRRSP